MLAVWCRVLTSVCKKSLLLSQYSATASKTCNQPGTPRLYFRIGENCKKGCAPSLSSPLLQRDHQNPPTNVVYIASGGKCNRMMCSSYAQCGLACRPVSDYYCGSPSLRPSSFLCLQSEKKAAWSRAEGLWRCDRSSGLYAVQ